MTEKNGTNGTGTTVSREQVARLLRVPMAQEGVIDRPVQQKPKVAIPEHVSNFLMLLQTRWPTGPTTPEWDKYEAMPYGRQAVRLLNEKMADQAYVLLRERHRFRPAVDEVKAVIDELTGTKEPLPGSALESFRDARSIRREAERHRDGGIDASHQITGTGESAARQSFRDRVRNLPGFQDSGKRTQTEKFNHIDDTTAPTP